MWNMIPPGNVLLALGASATPITRGKIWNGSNARLPFFGGLE
jgi:hypothetical protein